MVLRGYPQMLSNVVADDGFDMVFSQVEFKIEKKF